MDHLETTGGESLEGLEADIYKSWVAYANDAKACNERIEALKQEINKLGRMSDVALGRAQGVGQLLIKMARDRKDIVDEVQNEKELGALLGAEVVDVKPEAKP